MVVYSSMFVVTTIDGEMGVAHAFASISFDWDYFLVELLDRSWCGRFTPRCIVVTIIDGEMGWLMRSPRLQF